MSKIDTTGYDTALAQIPKGQLSEREQRIAAGIAMVREGMSMKRAARECQIPRTTLMRYVQGVSKLGTSNGVESRVQDVSDLSYDIARVAGEAVLESLTERREDWKPGDLVKAYGTATDKTIALNQQPKPQDSGVSALRALLEAGDVTIHAKKPGDEALDVTPEGEGE